MENGPSDLNGKKVLLVEDDRSFAKIVESKLTKVGCGLMHAENGNESLALLEKETPDAIILDILLPGGMDGFAVLEKIKANEKSKKIPVVILSNLGELTDIDKGMSLGAFRYIVKASIVPNEIVGHVVAAVNSTIK